MMRFLSVAVILAVFAGSALAEEVKIDPKTHAWAKFGVGSWTKMKTRNVIEYGGNKTESVLESTSTLLEVNENEAVVETESVTTTIVAGKETKQPPQKLKMPWALKYEKPAEQPKEEQPKPDFKQETGEEVIEVSGKKLKCTWSKITMVNPQGKTVMKTWSCEDVPGSFVKSETAVEGQTKMNTTSELVEFEAK